MKILRLFLFLTFITGVLYPLSVTFVAQVLFKQKAQGSLIEGEDRVLGSRLLGQNFMSSSYFHGRPSSANYATIPSGASQLSVTSKKLKDQFESFRSQNPHAQSDLWTTSASGLDPHISPASAYAQVERIAKNRGLSADQLKKLIAKHSEASTLGIWGRSRVNVLELNIDLLKVGNGNSGTAPQ